MGGVTEFHFYSDRERSEMLWLTEPSSTAKQIHEGNELTCCEAAEQKDPLDQVPLIAVEEITDALMVTYPGMTTRSGIC